MSTVSIPFTWKLDEAQYLSDLYLNSVRAVPFTLSLDGLNAVAEIIQGDVAVFRQVYRVGVTDPSILFPSVGQVFVVGSPAVGYWTGHDYEYATYGDMSEDAQVIDMVTTDPSTLGIPPAGYKWVVAIGAIGAWAGQDNNVAESDGVGGWTFTVPSVGGLDLVLDLTLFEYRRWTGSVWGGNWIFTPSVLGDLVFASFDNTQPMWRRGLSAWVAIPVEETPKYIDKYLNSTVTLALDYYDFNLSSWVPVGELFLDAKPNFPAIAPPIWELPEHCMVSLYGETPRSQLFVNSIPEGSLLAVRVKDDNSINSNDSLILNMAGYNGSQFLFDESLIEKSITVRGNAHLDNNHYVFCKSSLFLFDNQPYENVGNVRFSDGINVQYHTDFAIETSDFTVDLRVKFAEIPTEEEPACFLSRFVDINNWYYFGIIPSLGLIFRVQTISGILDLYGSLPVGLDLLEWHHYAVIRNGNDWILTIDGVAVVTETHSYTMPTFTTEELRIGYCTTLLGYAGTFNHVRGWIDSFRFSKEAKWTSFPFNVPLNPYKVRGAEKGNSVTVSLWGNKADHPVASALQAFSWQMDGVGVGSPDVTLFLNEMRYMPYSARVRYVSWGALSTGTGDVSNLELVYKLPASGVWTQYAVLVFPGGNTEYSEWLTAVETQAIKSDRFPAGTLWGIRDISTSTNVTDVSVMVFFDDLEAPLPPITYFSWQRELRLAFDQEGIVPR